MVKSVASMKDLGGRVAQIRGENAEKPSYEMADERDINAANALVELANGTAYFPEYDLLSVQRSSAVFRIPDNELTSTVFADALGQDANRPDADGKMKAAAREKLKFKLSEANHVEREHKKRKLENNFSLPKSKKHRNQCITKKESSSSHEINGSLYGCGLTSISGKKFVRSIEGALNSDHDGLGMATLESKKTTKKHKTKANGTYIDGWDECNNSQAGSKGLTNEPNSLKRKSGLRKVDAETVSLGHEVINDTFPSEDASVDDGVYPTKAGKMPQVTLIAPTLYTGFSFSIIHLLSAVRIALVTPHGEDSNAELGEWFEEGHKRSSESEDIPNRNIECVNTLHSSENVCAINSEDAEGKNVPSLTIHEIVWRVRLNPGDPCILETQERLLDLVSGALKLFSSRTAPLGAKGWKPLTMYEKSSKRWSWIGPVSFNLSIDDCTKEAMSFKAWGLPPKAVVRLVDYFASWLKNGEGTLKQVGSLPALPTVVMQPTNMQERFKHLRSHKSLITIIPSSDEVRAYFRREETLRYLTPDRAFSYTALDGRKSTVAPVRKCSGKPSVRARGHFMLKIDRPPQVTVLCLVRDAAARLPGSVGTRADICTLIRDSQFIVDDISDPQVNQVVSGALDRLHYELDPCVKYSRDRHLWVYLHGEREEKDFVSCGASLGRKSKGQEEMQESNLT